MPDTSSILRRLASAVAGTPPQQIRIVNGTIASVVAGASLDGVAAVSVAVGADTVPAAYNAAYTPTFGDTVKVLMVDGSPFILAHVVGLPAF